MKKWILSSVALVAVVASPAFAISIGQPAPDFTAKTSEGKTVRLSDYKGKTVVLEWLNYGCPFVKKHYESANMQGLQKEAADKGVVWLSVVSSAPGKQGHGTAAQAEKERAEHGSKASAVLLDETGVVGQQYEAQTTPHMYVVDPQGKLVYQGAIDDKPSTDKGDLKSARNYVREAVEAVLAKKPVTTAQTKAYGCGVKYN
jgi:peroxiredoxin